jgi:hypothetical protein
MLLQRNNAKTHTNAPTSVTIQNIRFEVVTYSLYSVVLAPSDFWLSAVVKKYPKVIHFTWDEEADGAIGKWFREQCEKLYSEKFLNSVPRWQE